MAENATTTTTTTTTTILSSNFEKCFLPKQFVLADNENGRRFFEMMENTVEKGEIAL